MTQVSDGGVPVQDLQDEQLEGIGRVQQAIPPSMTRCGKEIIDTLPAAEAGERIRLDPTESRSDGGHPWPPVGW
jgi:hypothetical protein